MADVTIIGGGSAARTSAEVLTRADFALHRTFEYEDTDRSPVILGEVPAALSIARQVVASGRHLLIANPMAIAPDRLADLFEQRRNAQSIFLRSERRFHPSYHFASTLIRTDATWHPRYLRHESLLTEQASPGLVRWSLSEALTLMASLAGSNPLAVSATSVHHPRRNAPDHFSLSLTFRDLSAFIEVGLGEAIERRETLIAADDRKAFIDELNSSVPLRLIADDQRAEPYGAARWLSCESPTREEIARQQCLAFLDATRQQSLAQEEANLWTNAFSTIHSAEESVNNSGAEMPVELTRPTEAEKKEISLHQPRPIRLAPAPPSSA